MLRFTSFLAEATKQRGISHIEHPADRTFDGADAAHHALNTIKGVSSGKTPITRKIDDKMSYQAIRDKNGRVGVKYKGAGSHYNFSHSDIDNQHGHKPYLAHPLHALLSHVGKVLPKGHGEYQGGFMSTPETRATSGGKISHTPNTLKYETDAKSEEGKKLKKSKISTVIHTKIDAEGHPHPITESIDITEAKGFGSHPDVHQVDHIVGKDERKLSPEHQKAVDHHVGEAEKLMKDHTYGHLAGHEGHLRTYINSTVRSGDTPSVPAYKAHLTAHHDKQIAAVKMEKTKAVKTDEKNNSLSHVDKHKGAFQRSFDIHHHVQQATNHLARGLDAASKHPFQTSIEGNKSGGEGYVANGVKVVDRTGFSAANLKATDRFKKK